MGSRKSWFVLEEDMNPPDRWFIKGPHVQGTGEDFDVWAFTRSKRCDNLPALAAESNDGLITDYTVSGLGVPYASERMASVLAPIVGEEVQFVPVAVNDERFFILNVLCCVDCVDEERSEFTKWTEEDRRPDKLGGYRSMSVLHVRPNAIEDHQILRARGWDVEILVSDQVRDAVQKAGLTGALFAGVS